MPRTCRGRPFRPLGAGLRPPGQAQQAAKSAHTTYEVTKFLLKRSNWSWLIFSEYVAEGETTANLRRVAGSENEAGDAARG